MKEKLSHLWAFMLLIVITAIVAWLLYKYFVVTLSFQREDLKLHFQQLR